MKLPEFISGENQLDDILCIPQLETVEVMRRLQGDIAILGIGGKMGPTLGRMLVRAAQVAGISKTIYGVSRFSDLGLMAKLEGEGIRCVRCDVMNPAALEALPDVPNIIYMVGRKFGLKGTDYLYWAVNTIAPANAARRFPSSRFVVFSTGSVYDLWPVETEGPAEHDEFTSIGEYANSCLGRERIFEYFSREFGTKTLIYRLNYAIDLRYGVLHDIAGRVHAGVPVNLEMGFANVIWQGDAANIAVRCLEHAALPPEILNVTGEKIRVREVALRLGELMVKPPVFEGAEAPTALLSNSAKMRLLFGPLATPLDAMLRWTAHWIMKGGRSLGKPTHFQTRDGQFLDEDGMGGEGS
jgi:nucleoside-diphosphate-sugar epimerase